MDMKEYKELRDKLVAAALAASPKEPAWMEAIESKPTTDPAKNELAPGPTPVKKAAPKSKSKKAGKGE